MADWDEPDQGPAPWRSRPATLSPGPAPTGRDKVFDSVYRWLGGKPENRWAADKLTDVATLGGMAPWTAAYDGGRELAETGRPAALATALIPGARVAAPVAKAAEKAVEKGIRAFHGSPHDFDRFDMSKIGTGQGAQAFGRGLYFAEAEDVARDYRNTLGGADLVGSTGNVNIDSMLRRTFGGDWEKAKASGYIPKHEIERIERDGLVPKATPRGRVYEVNINADPSDFLDWDMPLSQQGEKVRQAITPERARISKEDFDWFANSPKSGSGENIFRQMAKKLYEEGDETRKADLPGFDYEAAGNVLREAGIPGIRYLDGMSRTAGEGSRNYVVFDDSLIDIVRKYGIAGLLAAYYGGSPSQADAKTPQE